MSHVLFNRQSKRETAEKGGLALLRRESVTNGRRILYNERRG